MKTTYKLYRPFGPPIGKFKIPPKIVKKINDFVDIAVIDKVKAKELDVGSGLAGQVTQELALPEEIIQGELVQLFSSFTSDYINGSLGVQIKNFSLLQCWVVRQFKNEYNPVHWHGGHISGVGYLKVPKTFGKSPQPESKKNNNNGKIELIHGSRQFLSDSSFVISPEVGYFYFFPHYMMHTVYPFNGTDEERRSISFNATIDEKSFYVYGN